MIMGSVEPEECSALFSARSSEQSSLGLIRLDSVAGLSGCLLEDDSLPSARPGSLSPVKEAPASGDTADPRTPTSPDGYSPGMASCYEEVSEGDCTDGSDTESVPGADGGVDPRYLRCLTVAHDWEGAAAGSPPDRLADWSGRASAADGSSVSLLEHSSALSVSVSLSPLPVSRSCADAALPPAPPSPPGVSAVCSEPADPVSPAGGGGAARSASPLVPAADLSESRAAALPAPEHAPIPPPAALSPVPALAAPFDPELSSLLASRYLRAPPTPACVPRGAEADRSAMTASLRLSLPLEATGLETPAALSPDEPRLSVPPAADPADISGQQISARSTSIGAACGPDSRDFQDDTGQGFGSGCFDGLEDFQKEFHAGGFFDGGEAFKAELAQAEQSLDRNGLPLVNFSLSSGTYDPHAKIRPSDFDESVNISQFLKAGSYPMGVLGDASSVEPPPRFSMSMAQTSWQSASGRIPDDFDSTSSTLPVRSRDTFSVSHGSGYSQIHGAGGPVRVGTYTVLTTSASAPDASCRPDAHAAAAGQTAAPPARRRGSREAAVGTEGADAELIPASGREVSHMMEKATASTESSRGFSLSRIASSEQRYASQRAADSVSAEESRGSHVAGRSAPVERRSTYGDPKAAERGRASQDSQDASVTLVNASGPSQDSRDVTLTPERSPTGRHAGTATRPRPLPRHSAALGDSLRRKIVDVLNRTEEARLQLLVPGRQTPQTVVKATAAAAAAVTVSQRLTVTEMVSLSEQPLDDGPAEGTPAPEEGTHARPAGAWADTSAPLSDAGSAQLGSWLDGGEWPQAYSQARSDELKRRQQQEMAENKQRQEERIQAARDQQTALRKQWEAEQELKEKIARQKKIQKKRDAKARRDSLDQTKEEPKPVHDGPVSQPSSPTRRSSPRRPKPKPQESRPKSDPKPQQQPPPPPQPTHKAAPTVKIADPPVSPGKEPVPSYAAAVGVPDPEAVSRILRELNAAAPASVSGGGAPAHPLTMQQVVEAVMRQLSVPAVSLDESCRSRAELDVTDILQELRGEKQQLNSQMARRAAASEPQEPGGEKQQPRRAAASEPAVASATAAVSDSDGGGTAGGKDVTRMAETVSRLHRGVPARPRGEPRGEPRRRSPLKRAASIPVKLAGARRGPDSARPAVAAARRRPATTSERPGSAPTELSVRGRRVPRMGVRRHVEEHTADESDRTTASSRRGSPPKPGRKSPARTSAAAAIAATAAAAARAAAVSSAPDTARSDSSTRTYSIASDRAPGSLPAVVAEHAPEGPHEPPVTTADRAARAAPPRLANPESRGVSMDYDSPEFLVALAARRYPSSTPSLARSINAFVASESLDHVSPIIPADSDASEPSKEAVGAERDEQDVDSGADSGAESRSEAGGDMGKSADVSSDEETDSATAASGEGEGEEERVNVLVPPPAVWRSEDSAVALPTLELRHLTGTSTGSMTTAPSTAARASSAAVSLTEATSLQTRQQQQQQAVPAAGSSSAEAAAGAARPRRSRIPTPVRRHVSDLATATGCQSAPCLLQGGGESLPPPAAPPVPPPAPLPSAVPAAAVGRRPGAALSGGDRPAGPRPVLRANSAGTCDSAAQTGRTAAAAAVQRHARLARSASERTTTRPPTTAPATSRVSTQIQTSVTSVAAEKERNVETKAEGETKTVSQNDKVPTDSTVARARTNSVSTGVQTSDRTFTKPADKPPASAKSVTDSPHQPEPTADDAPALVSVEAQTETDQSWTEPTAKQRAERRTTVERVPSHRGDSAADGPPPHADKTDATAVTAAQRPHPPLPAPAERPEEPENSHVPAAAPEEEAAGSDGCLLVHTPAHVTHPDVLCTDIPAEVSVPVLNRTEHWLQLVPRVAAVELNGAALPLRDAAAVCTVSLRTRTLLDGHQEAAVRVSVTPRAAGRIAVTLLLAVEPIERRLSGLAAPDRSCRVELRLAAERPAVEVLSQEPGVLDFGTLPEDCRKVVPLTLVNLSRAAVPVTLSVLSAGRAFHLPDGDPPSEPGVAAGAAAPTRLTSTLAQFTLPPADASRQGISPVTLNVALLTPCLDAADTDCPPPLSLHGSLEVQLDGACPAPSEPLLSCRLTATVGRVKLRTRSREPLELRCRPAQTTSVNLPMRNAGNIPLELRLSVTGLRDSVWVRPEHVTVPARGERDVMLTFQPRDRHSGGRGLLVLTVQPDGAAYEVDIVGVIGDCREVERTRPSSPEMKSARRHTQARKQRRGSPRRHHSSGGSRSRSRSGSPGRAPPTSGRSGAQHAAVTEARDTGVQTSLLALAPAGDGPAAAAMPVLRQPAEPPPQPPKSHRAAAPALHSNKRLLLWTGVRCGRPTTRSLVLRNSSETEPLALRLAIVSGPQFSFRMFDEESGGGGGGGVSGASMELRLPARSERELTLVYQPARVEATAATLVIKPVVRPRGGVGSKFTIPLIAYSGSADIQLGVSAEQGLRLGEVQPAATVHAPLTVTNAGERSAFVTVLAYRDAECRHPLTSSEFSARPCKFSLSAGEMRQVALVLRLPPAGSPPPACLRLLSGDDLLRQAFSQLPRDQPLSSRLPSPGLMAVDFGGPFEGEQEPDPAELAALRKLPSVADTFFGCLRQTRLPIRATISTRAMDSSDVFTMLHADDTVASILNNTSFANVTREPRRAAVSAAAPVSSRAAPAQQSHHLSTSQRPVRLPAAAPCALRGPPVSDISVESGPVTCGAPEQLMPPPPPVCGLPPTLPPSFGGGGRPAPLQLDSDQVLFPTTAVGQRSPATLGFTNGSGVGLRWTLEALVKPWIQSTPRACDLTQVSGDVFRFHPTQGSVLPGQTLALSARFSPPAAGYFTQTFYLVTCADAAPLDSEQPVQPSCLLVRVAGQATPAPASAVQQPERFPLTVEPDTIEFPPDQRAVKLTINNKTRVDYEFELHVSGPFSVNHERMVSRARRYIHLPVFFQPPGAGLFTGRLTLSLSQPTGSAQRCFHVTLLGEVP